MDKIDFVIPWVDGGDADWQREFLEYRRQDNLSDMSLARYRDWDNLKYWFRAVDAFTPWVNNIWFITWGHLPPWLNTACPKLRVVNHRDYIPSEYLPTFSSQPIELNIHRIGGQSEKFVYFNDDMFITRPLGPERFFRGGLPCDIARLGIIPPGHGAHMVLNDIEVINRRYRKNEVIKRHPGKWFNMRYSVSDILKTMTMMPWRDFAGLKVTHMPQPFLRSTFERLWKEEPEVLDATSRNRFRTVLDVNQWLMSFEQIVSGRFAPVSARDTMLDVISDEGIGGISEYIRGQKYSMVCLNDSNDISDFEAVKNSLNDAFESILNEKCRYEI